MFILRTVLIYFSISSSLGYDELDLKFLNDFTSHYNFYSNLYHLIICRESESINLIKMLSASFRRFVTFHGADKALRPFPEDPQTFVLDQGCSQAMEILRQADRLNLFSKPFRWLFLVKDSDAEEKGNVTGGETTSLWTFVETLSVLPDSDFNLVERSPEGRFSVTAAYKTTPGKSLIEEPLAEWTLGGGLVVFNSKALPIRRWNLQGAVLPSSVVVTHDESLKHMDDTVDKHIDTTTKICYNVLKLLEDVFNVSFTYVLDHDWGIYKNGTWSGMIGRLDRKEVEFGSAPLFIRAERFHILEYYATVTPARAKFLFLSPPLSYSSNIFVMPFDDIVWLCCLGTVGISCCLLYAAISFERFHPDIDQEKKTENLKMEKQGKNAAKISFSEILILNIGAICLQGTVVETKEPPGRIITLFLYMSYMFLYISYSAAIVAILQSSDTSIRTFQDFINSPLQGGADEVIYSQYYFRNAKEEVRRKIYLTKIAPKGETPHFLSVEDGIKRVRKGFYAFHVEISSGYEMIQKTFTEEEKCALQELEGDYFQTIDPWLVIRRRSPYTEHFKIGLKKNIERGFKSRFVRRFLTKKPVCSAKTARFGSVGMIDCYYAFMLFVSGTVLSVVILLTELSFSRYYKRQEKRRLIVTPPFTFTN